MKKKRAKKQNTERDREKKCFMVKQKPRRTKITKKKGKEREQLMKTFAVICVKGTNEELMQNRRKKNKRKEKKANGWIIKTFAVICAKGTNEELMRSSASSNLITLI